MRSYRQCVGSEEVLIPVKGKGKKVKLVTPRRKSVYRKEVQKIKVDLGCRKEENERKRHCEFDEEEAKTSSPFCVA